MTDMTRRTLTRGMAWTVPVVAVAATAPAFAASAPPINLTYVGAIKCPGVGQNDKQYIFQFTADSPPMPGSVAATSLTIGGVPVAVTRVVIEGTTVYFVSEGQNDSADQSGRIAGAYTSGLPAVEKTFDFQYDGTHPDNKLCGRI